MLASTRLGTSFCTAVTSSVTEVWPAGITTCCGNWKRFESSLVSRTVTSLAEARAMATVSWKVSPSTMSVFEAVSVRAGNSSSSMVSRAVTGS